MRHMIPDTREVGPLARVLRATEPALYAPTLPGETTEERAARLVAAADITDELVMESHDPVTSGAPLPSDDWIAGGGDLWWEVSAA